MKQPESYREKLQRADDLRVTLEGTITEKVTLRYDMLSVYRSWLDREGIPAEVNGWPSEEAYDFQTINRFKNWWARKNRHNRGRP